MSICIRDYEKQDSQEVQHFIKEIYRKDKNLIIYYQYAIEKSYYIVEAIEKSKIVGVGSIWRNKFHDNATYIGVNVLPSSRRKGIGTDIFNILQGKKDKNNLQCAIMSNNVGGTGFVEALGFRLVRRTFEPRYDLSLKVDFNVKEILSNNFHICSLSKLNSEEDVCKFVKLFKEIYKRNHTFNKVSSISDEKWKNVIYDSLYLQGSLIVLQKNQIIGISLIYNGDEESTLELGLRGVSEEFLPLEKNILLTILSRQFQYVKENGFLFIKDEIDDCDSGAMVMSNFFDISSLISWNTFYRTS